MGALSFGLLNVLKESGYEVSYSELLQKLLKWIRSNRYEQTPQMSFGKLANVDSQFSFLK